MSVGLRFATSVVVTDFFDVFGTAFCNALVGIDFFLCLWDCVATFLSEQISFDVCRTVLQPLVVTDFFWCLWDCVVQRD